MSLEEKIAAMMASLEKKLDTHTAGLEKKIDNLTALHLETRELAITNSKEIVIVKKKLDSISVESCNMRKELDLLKDTVNKREQETRELSVRVLGLFVSEDEKKSAESNKYAIKQVYDRIFKPILTAARAKGLLDSVPQFNNCIEDGYRMGKGVTDEKGNLLPPPLVVRLKSMAVKVALFTCKRDALPKPSEAEMAAGIRKLLLVENLTLPTLHKLKEVRGDPRVEKVWTTEGIIRFTVTGKPTVVRKLTSVYKSLDDILK